MTITHHPSPDSTTPDELIGPVMPYVGIYASDAPARPKVGRPKRDRTKVKAARKARHR